MMFKRIHALLARMICLEKSPERLALTCALGIYIGISPLIGLHTAMVFAFGWMFTLSIPILFMVSVLIHNPWTMMPVYAIDHLFGKWLFSLLNIDYFQWDPVWMESCNLFLKEHTGIAGLSLSAFFVGGNVLAIGLSIGLYPLMKAFFARYLSVETNISAEANMIVQNYEKNLNSVRILRPSFAPSFAKTFEGHGKAPEGRQESDIALATSDQDEWIAS